MAKHDQKEARNYIRDTAGKAESDYSPLATGATEHANQFLGSATDNLNRASTGYQSFADTGGISDTDKNDLLHSATTGVANTYDVLRQQAEQNARATGSGAGLRASLSQLARHSGQDQAEATIAARSALIGQRNQNQLAGLGGLGNVGGAFGNLGTSQGAQALQALQQKYGTIQNSNAQLADLSNTPGVFDNIMKVGQLATGAAGAAAGLGYRPGAH